MWLMPLVVCVFIAVAISAFEKRAPLFVITLIIFEGSSNFVSTWYSYFGAYLFSDNLARFQILSHDSSFEALWRIAFIRPDWWSASNAAVLGFVLGFVVALGGAKISFAKSLGAYLEKASYLIQKFLAQFLPKLFPIFVVGSIAHVYKTGVLQHVVANYFTMFGYLFLALVVYLLIIFLIGNSFRLYDSIRNIKNLLPAGLAGLTSACSIATMPWTIKCVSMNLRDPSLAQVIIPATTNIQQIGDCIANAFLCFLIYKSFIGHAPDFATWMSFTGVFVLTRFATAGVTGGTTFLMLPIYQNYLSFNDEMIAIILAFNVLLDPIITSLNVIGNGAMAKVFENVWGGMVKRL